MSDLYNEATRHEYIRVPKYLFFLGGGLVADLKRMAARVAAARALAPEPALSERRPVRARLTRDIAEARELAEATAALLTPLLVEDEISVDPGEGEPGFALDVKPANRDRPIRLRLGFAERLEMVARGEIRFGDTGGRVLDWVPVYPGARIFSATAPSGGVRERFSMEWGDRMVTVVLTEDEFGGSLFVVAYKE